MLNLYHTDYNNFTSEELSVYLEERYYTQVLSDLEVIHKYLIDYSYEDETDTAEIIIAIFRKLQIELKQLFTKDSILIFPHFKNKSDVTVNTDPFYQIHQRINDLLQQIRRKLNNYVQQPNWPTTLKICALELYSLEQLVQHVLYLKQNFLWPKINTVATSEC